MLACKLIFSLQKLPYSFVVTNLFMCGRNFDINVFIPERNANDKFDRKLKI